MRYQTAPTIKRHWLRAAAHLTLLRDKWHGCVISERARASRALSRAFAHASIALISSAMAAQQDSLLLNCFPLRLSAQEAMIYIAEVPANGGFRKIKKSRITLEMKQTPRQWCIGR